MGAAVRGATRALASTSHSLGRGCALRSCVGGCVGGWMGGWMGGWTGGWVCCSVDGLRGGLARSAGLAVRNRSRLAGWRLGCPADKADFGGAHVASAWLPGLLGLLGVEPGGLGRHGALGRGHPARGPRHFRRRGGFCGFPGFGGFRGFGSFGEFRWLDALRLGSDHVRTAGCSDLFCLPSLGALPLTQRSVRRLHGGCPPAVLKGQGRLGMSGPCCHPRVGFTWNIVHAHRYRGPGHHRARCVRWCGGVWLSLQIERRGGQVGRCRNLHRGRHRTGRDRA